MKFFFDLRNALLIYAVLALAGCGAYEIVGAVTSGVLMIGRAHHEQPKDAVP